MVHRIVVEDQSLRWYGRPPKIADDSIEFVRFQFHLPEDWDPLVLVAQFTQADTYNVLLDRDTCFLPVELEAGICQVSLFGYSEGKPVRATSIPLVFQIEESGLVSSGETPIPPTPDLYSQLLAELKTSEENARMSSEQAETAAKNTDDNMEVFHKLDSSARESREKAELAETKASKSAEEAKTSENNAAKSAEEAKKAAESVGGGSGIDVTAKPGQMIRVKSVDENGKPAAWEPVPWGWVEGGMVEVLAECQPNFDESAGVYFLPDNTPAMEAGNTYLVNWNGTEYVCTSQEINGIAALGDIYTLSEGQIGIAPTGDPFGMLYMEGLWGVIPFDGSTELTISISQKAEIPHPIPGKLLPEGVPYVEKGVILEETDMVEFTYPNFGKVWGYTAKAPNLTVGETYTIIYNGVPYDCVCHPGEDTGLNYGVESFALGNFSVVGGEDTGEPFAMLIFPSWPQIAIIDLSGATSVRVGITVNGETVHKLDNRCLDLAWLPTVVFTKGEVLVPEQIPNEAGYFNNANFAVLNPDITNLLITVNGVEHLCSATVEELTSASDGDYIVMQCATPVGPFVMEYRPNNGAETYAYIGIPSGLLPTVSVYIADQGANRMPEEFLPEGVPYVEHGAKVGQTVKISAVDENGVPTAWESVYFPSSGGNVDLEGYATEQWVKDQKYLTEVPEGYAKDEDIPTKPEDIGAQPAGNYLTEVPSGYATEEFVKNKIAEAELGGEEVDLSGYAQKSELPTKVSQLQNDSGYLTKHQDISGKLDVSELPTAINTALAQAKASGEFDGYTPVKGKDYWTDADKLEIKSYVDEAILGGEW